MSIFGDVYTFLQNQEKSLQSVNFSLKNTPLDSKQVYSIGKNISQLENILELELDFETSSSINSKRLIILLEEIQYCQNLKHLHLNLCNTYIDDEGLEYIRYKMIPFYYLESFQMNIGINQISDVAALYISQGLQQLKNLKKIKLNISDTQIRRQGISLICQSLTWLKLHTIDLNFKSLNVNSNAMLSLFEALNCFFFLQQLSINLDNNIVVDDDLIILFQVLSQLPLTKIVNLSAIQNKLEGEFLIQLPDLLSSSKITIFSIDLRKNRIQRDQVPVFLKKLTKTKSKIYKFLIDLRLNFEGNFQQNLIRNQICKNMIRCLEYTLIV
ncbi:hypothetical protein ABPG74_005019 [Tetrahymena malaccensis]